MPEIQCHKCKYKWEYKGQLATACCPNCQSKVKMHYDLDHKENMVKLFGKDALKGKIVHHINGVPSDNRPENLMLLTRSEHVSLHLKKSKERCDTGKVTIPLILSKTTHARLAELKDGLGLTWEEFFLKPYENMESPCDRA